VARLQHAKTVELQIHSTKETNRTVVIDDEYRHAA
jgi:hypothetical protein